MIFDVKVECCGFIGFVNNVIDCKSLERVFCFKIKKKEKEKFYINFYSLILLQSFLFYFIYFSLLQSNNYNKYACTIYNYCFL